MNAYLQLIRREFWEHRAFLLAPLAIGALMLIAIIYALISGAANQEMIDHALAAIAEQSGEKMRLALFVIYALFTVEVGVVLLAVSVFYLLDCLHADRKDRSILFWKSLPISDVDTVLVKFFTGAAVLPLLALVAATAIFVISLILMTVFVWTVGGSAWELIWGPVPLFAGAAWLLVFVYSIVLWFLPFAAWLLLCSAWSKALPILWAILTPAGIIFAEHILLGSNWLAEMIGRRFESFGELIEVTAIHSGSGLVIDSSFDGDELPGFGELLGFTGEFVASPGLWIGLIVTAAFVTGAIWLRRTRTEI